MYRHDQTYCIEKIVDAKRICAIDDMCTAMLVDPMLNICTRKMDTRLVNCEIQLSQSIIVRVSG